MRVLAYALAVPAALLAVASVEAADCEPGVIAVTPDKSTYSVPFFSFGATPNDPGTCDLPVPVEGVPEGSIAVYLADYTGFVIDEATARLRIEHDGVVEEVDINGLADGSVYTHYIGSGLNGKIQSDITLSVPFYDSDLYTGDDPLAELGAVDYVEAARTTLAEVDASVGRLALGMTSVVTHLGTTSRLLTGVNQPFERPDSIGLIGAVGSGTFGVTAHAGLGDGFSVDAGGAWTSHSVDGSGVSGGLASANLRYSAPGYDSFQPYAQIGVTAAPGLQMSFSRSYDDNTEDGAAASSSTSGSLYGVEIEGGVMLAPDPDNQIVFSATLGHSWLGVDAFSETMSEDNLFAASMDDQTLDFSTIKAGAAWTTNLTPELDLTLHGGVGRTIAPDSVAANVMFVGDVDVAGRDESFAEYGARLGWAVTDAITADAFVLGTTGELSGTHVQAGSALRIRF